MCIYYPEEIQIENRARYTILFFRGCLDGFEGCGGGEIDAEEAHEGHGHQPSHDEGDSHPLQSFGDRSEERRVGKEGRSRWSPDHEKKKHNT